jgi:phosphatidylglycerol---prolipoprotein diacylglyceryl transferase
VTCSKLAPEGPDALAGRMMRWFRVVPWLALAAAAPLRAATGDAPPPTGPYWVDNLDPFLVHFPASWPLPGIRWYGLAYFAGIIIAAVMMHWYAKRGRLPLNADQRSTLLTAIFIGVLVGGRLGYCLLYRPGDFFANPLIIFETWNGGMASHGGFIGGTLAIWWFGRSSGLGFWRLSDVAVTLMPPGLFLGRLANFVNGELWGKPTTVPWAVIFPVRENGLIVSWMEPRHPSQLYEAALEGLLLFAYTQWRWWSTPPPGKSGSRPAGQLAGETLILYALVRIFCEIFREPDEGISLLFGLSRGTFYSLVMLAAGAVVIARARSRPTPTLPKAKSRT